jgi:hypothetical protein
MTPERLATLALSAVLVLVCCLVLLRIAHLV